MSIAILLGAMVERSSAYRWSLTDEPGHSGDLSSNCSSRFRIEPVLMSDLTAASAVIERAVMNWPLPEKLRRASIAVLRYGGVDLDHFEIFACRSKTSTIGVLALDFYRGGPDGRQRDVLLHGLYIDPLFQHQGLGKKLVAFAERLAGLRFRDEMTIKAERVSCAFFERCGYRHRPPGTDTDYPYCFSKSGLIRRYIFGDSAEHGNA